jgi:hypothetical protein
MFFAQNAVPGVLSMKLQEDKGFFQNATGQKGQHFFDRQVSLF